MEIILKIDIDTMFVNYYAKIIMFVLLTLKKCNIKCIFSSIKYMYMYNMIYIYIIYII